MYCLVPELADLTQASPGGAKPADEEAGPTEAEAEAREPPQEPDAYAYG